MKRIVMLCLAVAALCWLAGASQSPSSLKAPTAPSVEKVNPAQPLVGTPNLSNASGIVKPVEPAPRSHGASNPLAIADPAAPAASLNLAPAENPEIERLISLIVSAKADGLIPDPSWYARLVELRPPTPRTTLDQGNDACPATVIPGIPYTDTGSTVQYINDYTGSCVGWDASDVIYEFTPSETNTYTVSLCGSQYDTGLYIRTGGSCPGDSEVDCNDDWCGLQSQITTALTAGTTYWIIIDGFGSSSGDYYLNMWIPQECIIECLPGDVAECYEDVNDTTFYRTDCNGGCNNDPTYLYQTLECGQTVCGDVFTYVTHFGAGYRDTDWYLFTITSTQDVSWTVEAEVAVNLFILDVTNCNLVTLASGSAPNPCIPATITADDLAPGTYAVWVGTPGFSGVPTPKMYRGTLSWDCPSCADFVVTAPGVWTGNTCNAGNDCDFRDSQEHIYEVTIPTTGGWMFSLCEEVYHFDTYLILASECCDGVIDYNDDGCAINGLQSMIPCLSLDAGVYYVIVEAYGPTACGDYTLTIEECTMCDVVCQPGDVLECYEDVNDTTFYRTDCNGGCNNMPELFQTLLCGQTVCGDVFTYVTHFGASYRDTDWYLFTITSTQDVSWTVEAEVAVNLFIMDVADCFNFNIVASGSAPDPCIPATLTADDLPPGTYAAFVSTQVFSGVETPMDYRGTLSWDCPQALAACCYGEPTAPQCQNTTETGCIALQGTWYPDQNCDNFDCPIQTPPPVCPENSTFAQPPYAPEGSWGAYTSDNNNQFSYLVYDNFFDVNGPICDIHWWGLNLEYDNGWYLCDAEEIMTFAITFYTTNPNGGPGDPACTYTIRVTRQPTGLLYAGYPLWYWGTTIDPCCTLTSGWVSIQGVSGANPDCVFLWMTSPIGDDVSYQQDATGAMTPLNDDLAFCLTPAETEDMDMGDILHPLNTPFGYPTQVANPGHQLTGIAWLGENITGEPAPNTFNLDQADDGVVFPPYMIPCTPTSVTVTVSTWNVTDPVLYLNAWKDGNNDGDFCDVLCPVPGAPGAPEWIIQDVPVYAGVWTFTFIDPGVTDVPPYTGWFRFRLTSQAVGQYGFGLGGLPNWDCQGTFGADYLGEVEDYWMPDYQLAVELTSFDAIPGEGEVALRWRTASESSNDYFEILRDGVEITTVASQGNSATGHAYSFVDEALEGGVAHTYTLVAVDLMGARSELATASATPYASAAGVTEYALYQNYPNPFNPATTIAFDLVESGTTSLAVYNMMGQQVATLVNGSLEAGHHTVTFDASSLPSGTYWYRLTSGDFSAVKKMMLMK